MIIFIYFLIGSARINIEKIRVSRLKVIYFLKTISSGHSLEDTIPIRSLFVHPALRYS